MFYKLNFKFDFKFQIFEVILSVLIASSHAFLPNFLCQLITYLCAQSSKNTLCTNPTLHLAFFFCVALSHQKRMFGIFGRFNRIRPEFSLFYSALDQNQNSVGCFHTEFVNIYFLVTHVTSKHSETCFENVPPEIKIRAHLHTSMKKSIFCEFLQLDQFNQV